MIEPTVPVHLFATPAQGPAQIDLLLLPEFSLMSLAATVEPLRAANRVSARTLYAWRLLSVDGAPAVTSSGLAINVHGPFLSDTPRDALIVIAAFNARRHAVPLLAGLRRAARRGVPLGGIESGSWVLAQAGLLDHHRATTHWEEIEEFALKFPEIEAVVDRYVVDRKRFTAGGAAPALDMILDMLRRQHGLALALDVASIFIYDPRQSAHDEQRIVAVTQLAGSDRQLAETIRCMQAHLDEPLSIGAVARRIGLSTRALQLRFHARLGMSPYAYYLNLRLSAARRMLQQTRHSAGEVASAYGFGSGSAFARAFRIRYGVSPTEARRLAAGTGP